ncbi:MAG: hypothetical protein PVJ61_03995 [Dehalococcoidia bacterium]|jgi:hypothetical protein
MPDRRQRDKGWWKGIEAYPPKSCFIATAAFGTDAAREIDVLRDFRDEVLLPNSWGARFVSFYYKNSPPLADFIARHDTIKSIVRGGFIYPLAGALNISRRLWS